MASSLIVAAQVARTLVEIGAVGVKAKNPITFKSGIISPVYVDNRTLPYHPKAWKTVIEGFQTLIEEEKIAFDVLAGVAVGGVPHASALGYLMQRPSLFVRKEAKGYGKEKRVEGGTVEGKKILLIEDLITTGSSSLSGVEALRQEGGLVDTILAIVTYSFKEAGQAFEKENITAHTLTTFPIIMQQGLEMGRFDIEEQQAVMEWLDDPHGWWNKKNGDVA
ncbi:MAG: orotate phosphoribosyltransferase [Alphaproteobacteria bacterium]|nr:orotate phosphoribosyltransferase [Alphaproteobacteria bacterium]